MWRRIVLTGAVLAVAYGTTDMLIVPDIIGYITLAAGLIVGAWGIDQIVEHDGPTDGE